MRFGTVAIVGRTNVGKSSFLNACLGEKLAIVSPLPQTTREQLLGVLNRADAQIAFTDTPGLHRPKTELGRRMNATALDSVRTHDIVLFMTDVSRLLRRSVQPPEPEDPIASDDRRLLQLLNREVPTILAINKVDLLKDKSLLLPLIAAFHEAHPFAAVVPVSVTRGDGIETVVEELVRQLPHTEGSFEQEVLTDRPLSFFAREFVREQVLLQTRSEVPHAVAVTLDSWVERRSLIVVSTTIHVEKDGQRAILLGRGGERIREIGTRARQQIETLAGKKVHLELFVRISPRWKDVPRQLAEFGYEGQGRTLSSALPARKARRPKRPNAARDGKRPAPPEGTPGKTAAARKAPAARRETPPATPSSRPRKPRPHPKPRSPRQS